MKQNISCIIIDDEPHAIEALSDSLAIVNKEIVVIGTYTSWSIAFEALRSIKVDLIFLDISIQGKNGMELLNGIPNLESEVIFVTAYSNYAVRAFKYAASGYILKPIDEVDLASAVDTAIGRIMQRRNANKNAMPHSLNNKVGIPDNKSIHYINTDDIVYLEADNSYTNVIARNLSITSAYNIGKFKSLLDDTMFYQVHRSYIVNLNCVIRYDTSGIAIMENGKEIPVSKNYRDIFTKLFVRIKKLD